MDSFAGADPVQRRLRRLGRRERHEEAIDFIRQYARETGMEAADRRSRQREIAASLRRGGHYEHSLDELAFGARLAWRNHSRCIGRLWWKSLDVIDCRRVEDPGALVAALFHAMEGAWAGGRIRSRVVVFAPARPGYTPSTIESPQLLQYAGYLHDDGSVIGDRQNVELTRTALALGWRSPSPRGAFDLLPLIVRASDGTRHLFDIPASLSRQVPITHPSCQAIGDLGLRWYGLPCVTNMVMTIGGIEYPCAPFNGHYMATEIASRDFADRKRYDLLPAVAGALGLDPDGTDPLWRDRALTELNAAVLHSYQAAGVEIIDHHAASQMFMEFVKQEQREGRAVSADWSWIVPPQAAAACPVFHLPMQDLNRVPNFFYSRAVDGAQLAIDRTLQGRTKWQGRYDRMVRAWRGWRRQRDHLWRG